jgi:hypothetical protein
MNRFFKANIKYFLLFIVAPLLIFFLVLIVRRFDHSVSQSYPKSVFKERNVDFNWVSLGSSKKNEAWQTKLEDIDWRHQSASPFVYYFLVENDSLESVNAALRSTYDWAENLIVTQKNQPIKVYVFPNWNEMVESLSLEGAPRELIWPRKGIVIFLSSEKGSPDQLATVSLISYQLRERVEVPPLWLELGLRQLALKRIASGVEIVREGDLGEVLLMDRESFSLLDEGERVFYQARCGGLIEFIIDERGQEGVRLAVDAAASGFEREGILEFALKKEFGEILKAWGGKVPSVKEEFTSQKDSLNDKYKRGSKFVILVYVLSVIASILGIVTVYYVQKR